MLKFADGSDLDIEGLLAPWGGPFNGSDIAGERFSAKTDFALDWFPDGRPLLYHHGLDPDAGAAVVGRISEVKTTDKGLWMRAQLDAASKYYGAIKELIKQGKLGLSSGSMRHLVEVSKSGEILRWPLIEGSLTPTPANPDAEVSFAAVKAHLDAIGVAVSDDLKAKLDAEARDDLDASDFAYIDSEGGRHLPMHDAAHARNALARFEQTTFESDAAKQKARRKLAARAKEMGIEMSDDMTKAAKMGPAMMRQMMADMATEMDMEMSDEEMATMMASLDADMPKDEMSEAMHKKMVARKKEMMGKKATDLITLLLEDDPALDTALAGLPIITHAEVTAKYAALLVGRTKDLRERRVKEGRILSGMNRKRIRECMDAMDGAMTALRDLYESTEPQPAKAASVQRVQAQMQALRLRALAI